MKDNIVAIFGFIIPDPFAIPFINTFFGDLSCSECVFGNVSVVVIALAALSQEFELFWRLDIKKGICLIIFFSSYGSPITPVDAI